MGIAECFAKSTGMDWADRDITVQLAFKQLYRLKMPPERTLESMLSMQTIDELKKIIIHHGLDIHTSQKKATLVAELSAALPSEVLPLLKQAVGNEYEALQEFVKGRAGIVRKPQALFMHLFFMKDRGLISCARTEDDELVWYMPEEVRRRIKANSNDRLRVQIDRNTKIATIVNGLVQYYGYIKIFDLYDMINGYLSDAEKVTDGEYIPLLLDHIVPWTGALSVVQDGVCHLALEDVDWLEHEKKLRADLPAVRLTYEQVRAAGLREHILTPEAAKLLGYLVGGCMVPLGMANKFVRELYYAAQTTDTHIGREMGQLLDAYEFKLNEGQLRGVIDRVMALANNMPLWILKGNTPTEAGRIMQANRTIMGFGGNQRRVKKVGRNEPCPCGSGKKYKNCCLRKDEEK